MLNIFNNTWSLITLAVVIYMATLAYLMSSLDVEKLIPPPPDPYTMDTSAPGYFHWNFHSHEINKMIEDLRIERERLDEREEGIAAMEARIASERRELERIKRDIEQLREDLAQYMNEVTESELANLRTEVSVLNALEPPSVVAIFNERSDEDVVKILALMKPDAIAPIIDLMMRQDGRGGAPSAVRVNRLLDQLQRLKKVKENQG
jgi:septal ring factor EnvC (AmiA/AmiB activator)